MQVNCIQLFSKGRSRKSERERERARQNAYFLHYSRIYLGDIENSHNNPECLQQLSLKTPTLLLPPYISISSPPRRIQFVYSKSRNNLVELQSLSHKNRLTGMEDAENSNKENPFGDRIV